MALDVFFLDNGSSFDSNNFIEHKKRFPHIRKLETPLEGLAAYKEAAKLARTSSYFVIDSGHEILSPFCFDYKPEPYDKNYTHVWKEFAINQKIYRGVYLFNKYDISNADELSSIGKGIKLIDEVASKGRSYDIVFISYDEPNAEENWNSLVTRFPLAKRIDKIDGILNAHKMAASLGSTKNFYVVDGDSEIINSFGFGYRIPKEDSEYVHIWKCQNPANGLSYGYGGIKLFNREMFDHIESDIVDMSTILGTGIKIIDEIASITKFDTSSIHAFRAAFRECTKLSSRIIKNQIDDETKKRLEIWCSIATGQFKDDILLGANAGKEYGITYSDDVEKLQMINDYQWIAKKYEELK